MIPDIRVVFGIEFLELEQFIKQDSWNKSSLWNRIPGIRVVSGIGFMELENLWNRIPYIRVVYRIGFLILEQFME